MTLAARIQTVVRLFKRFQYDSDRSGIHSTADDDPNSERNVDCEQLLTSWHDGCGQMLRVCHSAINRIASVSSVCIDITAFTTLRTITHTVRVRYAFPTLLALIPSRI